MDFHFDQAYHIILQSDKITAISSKCNVHLFTLTNIIIYHFGHRTYDSHILAIFGLYLYLYLERIENSDLHCVFFIHSLFERTYDYVLTMYFQRCLDIDFCFICERAYNYSFVLDFLFTYITFITYITYITYMT